MPDFPRPGILFKDLSPVFGHGPALAACVDAIAAGFAHAEPDAVAGIEARGFVVGAAVAYATGTGVVPVRKAGKLPRVADRVGYDLEYGTAELELPADVVRRGQRVLLVDDLLATGGTVLAAIDLLRRAGAEVAGVAVVVELAGLGGREKIGAAHPELAVHALLTQP